MLFGLCNAPVTFERLMERVMRGIVGKGVQCSIATIFLARPPVGALVVRLITRDPIGISGVKGTLYIIVVM